jgi:hypothetical protein
LDGRSETFEEEIQPNIFGGRCPPKLNHQVPPHLLHTHLEQ